MNMVSIIHPSGKYSRGFHGAAMAWRVGLVAIMAGGALAGSASSSPPLDLSSSKISPSPLPLLQRSPLLLKQASGSLRAGSGIQPLGRLYGGGGRRSAGRGGIAGQISKKRAERKEQEGKHRRPCFQKPRCPCSCSRFNHNCRAEGYPEDEHSRRQGGGAYG